MSKPAVKPSLVIGLPERSGFLLPALTVWVAGALNFASLKRTAGVTDLLNSLEGQPIVLIVGLALLGVYMVFLLGHIIDLLSNGINERFLANKMDGYPHERLIPFEYTTPKHRELESTRRTNLKRMSFFFEGAKLMISSVSMYVLLRLIIRHPAVIENIWIYGVIDVLKNYFLICLSCSVVFAIPTLLVKYFPWHTIDARKQFAMKIIYRIKKLIRRPEFKLFEKFWTAILSALFWLPIAGYDTVDKMVRSMIRLDNQLDKSTFDRLCGSTQKHLGISFEKIANNDRFWLPYLYLHKKEPALGRKIDENKRFSSFCRNQSLACFIAAVTITGVYRDSNSVSIGTFSRGDFVVLSLLLFFAGWLFHWKFLHHYYSFTKMTLRAFVLIDVVSKSRSKGSSEAVST